MTDFEIAFASRCAAITDTRDDSDWLDVQRRVRRSSRRRKLTIALIAAAAVLIVAPALALRGTIIDFFSADPAPTQVVRQFGSMEVGAPPGMAPGALPGQARRVTSVRSDGKTHILYVAPTRGGGFCVHWTYGSGGCRATRTLPPDQAAKLPPDRVRSYNSLGVTFSGNATGVTAVNGHVLVPGSTVEVRYEDGDSAVVPVVWVSKPIDAGFFYYGIPTAHRTPGHRATSIVLLDSDGQRLASEKYRSPPATAPHRLPDGRMVTVPARAIWEKRHIVIDFRAANGQRITLWTAPSRAGGRCYWWNQGSRCPTAGTTFDPPVQISVAASGKSVRLFGPVAPTVATVSLLYQDGSTETIKPTEGFILTEIAATHYARGHRLTTAVGYDTAGREVGRSTFQPHSPGLYPCAKPRDYGYGVKQCP